jgi:hypothetical protein
VCWNGTWAWLAEGQVVISGDFPVYARAA